MRFLWPGFLWALVAVPLLPALYLFLLRNRRDRALRYSSLALVREAAGRSWRRHVPAALLWLALSALALAVARPTASLTLPWSSATVILAMDVSLSMRVSDVKPTRIAAAQDAAKAFLQDLPKGIDVGLVTFAGTAQVVQRATADRAALVAAIDAFQMQYGTAIGNAIVLSLAELFPEQGIDLAAMTFGARPRPGAPAPREIVPVAPGSYGSAAIVLLSDGRRTMGVDTLAAARMAADRGVKIHVVGLGTVDGASAEPEGMAIFLKLDEPTLREVARLTGGEYHHAGTAETLRRVYESLGSRLQVRTRETELAPALSGLAALLLLAAVALAMATRRIA